MVDIMAKSWISIFCWWLSVVIFADMNMAEAQIVRKKYEPSFFVPQGELEVKPKEVPIVKYRRGEMHSVSHKEREKTPPKKVLQAQNIPNIMQPANNIADNSPTNDVAMETKEVPEYQQVYQEYLEDVDKVAKGRKMPKNIGLQKDLAKMDSNERIKIDKEFNANRDVVSDFKNALNY